MNGGPPAIPGVTQTEPREGTDQLPMLARLMLMRQMGGGGGPGMAPGGTPMMGAPPGPMGGGNPLMAMLPIMMMLGQRRSPEPGTTQETTMKIIELARELGNRDPAMKAVAGRIIRAAMVPESRGPFADAGGHPMTNMGPPPASAYPTKTP